LILSSTHILPLTQHCIILEPIVPLFRHSTIPIGAKPLTCFIVMCQYIRGSPDDKMEKIWPVKILNFISLGLNTQ
jgi:hypothetical protein